MIPLKRTILTENHLRVIILNFQKRTEFALNGRFLVQPIADLQIQLLSGFFRDKIYFFFTDSSDTDVIAPAQEFQCYDIFENNFSILDAFSDDGFTQSMVGNIIFLIYPE